MKIPFLLCFLSLFLAVSCGSDNDNSDKDPVAQTEQPQNEDDPTPAPSRYSEIKLQTTQHVGPFFDHTLQMDLGRRPVFFSANFQAQPGEITIPEAIRACNFQFTISDVQATKLEALGNRLRFCKRDWEFEDEQVDSTGSNTIRATEQNGTVTEAYKNDLGRDLHIDQTWLCAGKTAFYNYVKTLTRPKVPDSCPPGALSKF